MRERSVKVVVIRESASPGSITKKLKIKSFEDCASKNKIRNDYMINWI